MRELLESIENYPQILKDSKYENIYSMDLKKDRFIHFTPESRARQIVSDGKLLMNPPYRKFGIDAVTAVSLVWGEAVEGVQTTHIKMGEGEKLVGVVFKTDTLPEYSYIEEVIWHRDVRLIRPEIVSHSKGLSMLRRAKPLPEEAVVKYR